MFGYAGSISVILREASRSSITPRRSREGEGTPEDILARLSDGKRGPEANELEFVSHGKERYYNSN